ncbi:MAG TPA: hypothetical protein VMS60_12870 [Solirubrobacterales bacterium]|nr:hypothetical protein [Solirubrobacterales bacterium]
MATELAVRAWSGAIPIRRLVPEGLDDISVELGEHWLHLQVKSRRENRGEFTLGDLSSEWARLAERLRLDENAHAGLVLERPLGSVETGLDKTLAECDDAKLRRAAGEGARNILDREDFLARVHVLVCPSPEDTAVRILAEKLGLPPASCVAHQALLRRKLADLADENGVRAHGDPAAVSTSGIGRWIDELSEAIDPSALEEAVREGVAELVDFVTPIEDEGFYAGVDVVPGHVVAGLAVGRPEVEGLLEGLESCGLALAIGPSGAGKSALIWLTAFANRHRYRWYRVRRLREEDVPALIRLANGLAPGHVPLGFVVDDLGRDDRAGFDLLIEELREHPQVVVLGACREEDLFLIGAGYRAAEVRPELTPALAERIWEELRGRGETKWSEWREAYEQCGGLLLEYGHLLSEGERLAKTISMQVARRIGERRSLELEVLRLVATADAFGAEIGTAELAQALRCDRISLRAALERLLGEHLIIEREGRLGGLHELRSQQVMDAVHRRPPPVLAETVGAIIEILSPADLQVFLMRLMAERQLDKEVIIGALGERLDRQQDAASFTVALQALRVAGFRRSAEAWPEILREEGAAAGDIGLITYLVINDGDTEIFPAPVQSSVARLREVEVEDAREELLRRAAVSAPMARAGNASGTAALLAALAGLGAGAGLDPAQIAAAAEGQAIAQVKLLLETAYLCDPALAQAVADALGGADALLERLGRERPWTRGAGLTHTVEGEPAAEASYAFVAEATQPDPHDAVVELCRYLIALAPQAEFALCRAVDASGELAGLGEVPIAEKAIARAQLPSDAEVAWNRARVRATAAVLAASSQTDYLLTSAAIIRDTSTLLAKAANTWARGKRPTPALADGAVELNESARRLSPPPFAGIEPGVLDQGEMPGEEPVGYLGTMGANLVLDLFNEEASSAAIAKLLESVEQLLGWDRWRLLSEPPSGELERLQRTLTDLYAIVAERRHGGEGSRAAMLARGKTGVHQAAEIARTLSAARVREQGEALAVALGDAGFRADVSHRQQEPDLGWASPEYLVAVEIASAFEWLPTVEQQIEICRGELRDDLGFLLAPVREGRLVASSALRVFSESVYPDEALRDWEDPAVPLLDERLGDLARRGIAKLNEASGIIASIAGTEIHDDEAASFASAEAGLREVLEEIREMPRLEGAEALEEIFAELSRMQVMLAEEADALSRGEPIESSFAASLIEGLRDKPDDTFHSVLGTLALCVEWDADPGSAMPRFEEAIASSEEFE